MIILRRLKSAYLPQVLCFCHGAQRSSTYYASFTTHSGQIAHLTTLYNLPYSKDMTGSRSFCRDSSTTSLQGALEGNRRWAQEQTERDPTFFNALAQQQRPQWLWIGCSDSRVPANELLGMGPGTVFVQRNVGNLATHKDMNVMSCMEYAVLTLKVKHVIVCGHYGCGAVKAALELPCKSAGLVNLWIQDIRDERDRHVAELHSLPSQEDKVNRLVELNVMRQVFNVCTSPVIQQAWDAGQHLAVHGLVYDLKDGILRELTKSITCIEDIDHYVKSLKQEDNPLITNMCQQVLNHMSFEKGVSSDK